LYSYSDFIIVLNHQIQYDEFLSNAISIVNEYCLLIIVSIQHLYSELRAYLLE